MCITQYDREHLDEIDQILSFFEKVVEGDSCKHSQPKISTVENG